jgi:type I restriction enzyme S subunit
VSELPPNWALARVGDLVELGPKNDCPDGTEVGFVPLQRLGVDYRSRHTFEPRPWAAVKKGYTHFADGDVLLARITPSFENGKAGIMRGLLNGIGAGSTEYFVCRPIEGVLLPEYLLAHFKTPEFLRDGEQVMSGAVGQQRVPKQYVLDSKLCYLRSTSKNVSLTSWMRYSRGWTPAANASTACPPSSSASAKPCSPPRPLAS